MSACYAYIGYLCAWLKYYYPEQFMAATLSIQDNSEDVAYYVNVCLKMGIQVSTPDINISTEDFTPDPAHNRILYGLSAIKGVGGSVINDIISNAPYKSLEDAIERVPKKAFNKRVAEGIIKAGGFDWLDKNRINVLNKLHELRGDKKRGKDGRIVKGKDGKAMFEYEDPESWNETLCMKFEEDVLGSHITYRNWWEELPVNGVATFTGKILSVREHKQKNGKLMAFVTMEDQETKTKIDCCIFAKQYAPLNSFFFGHEKSYMSVNGKKSEKGSFIINDASPVPSKDFLEDVVVA